MDVTEEPKPEDEPIEEEPQAEQPIAEEAAAAPAPEVPSAEPTTEVAEAAGETVLPEEISSLVADLDREIAGEEAPVWKDFTPDGSASVAASVPWWPFLVYLALWVALAALETWQFSHVPAGKAVYDSAYYALSLVVNLWMLIAGGALTLLVWVVSVIAGWPHNRGRKFLSAIVKGALVTFAGAALWWLALILVDVFRQGSPF